MGAKELAKAIATACACSFPKHADMTGNPAMSCYCIT